MPNNRIRLTCVLSALIVATAATVPAARTSSDAPRPAVGPQFKGRLRAASLQLPMRFEPSQDVGAARADFIARGPNYAVYLSGGQSTLLLEPPSGSATPPTAFSMRLVGASRGIAAPTGLEPLPGITNHLVGNDPQSWKTGVHGYGKVEYRDVYPGVNLIYYGNQRQLEYDFVVAAGARATDIVMALDGASHVAIDDDGGLVIATERGELRQPAPVIYQHVNGARQSVEGAFVIDTAGHVRFRVGRYDRRLPLVIDPVLTYSTYLGGGGGDAAMGVAVDAVGNIYLAGETASLDFPHQNGAQPTSGGGSLDAFVVKLNATGDQLVYATYLGGSNYEYAKDIAVDASGNAYVTGSTSSTNFPTLHALQPALRGISDGFVTKLDATGAIVYSTYLGGKAEDYAYGIAVDHTGRPYVTGQTISPDFPTVGALQPSRSGAPVWTSVNGVQSFSGLPSLAASAVLALAIDPVSPSVVYAGFENGVAKSADSGHTWSYSTDLPIQVSALAIDPITPSTVFAGTASCVARSRDGGVSWTTIGLFGTKVTAIAIDPATARTVYAGSSSAIFKSTDGGDHWTGANLGPYVWSLSLSRSTPSTIYAATDRGVLKTTTGGGATFGDWAWANTGLPTGMVFSVAVDPTDASVAYAGTNGGLFKTTTGGSQWLPVPGGAFSIWSIAIPTSAPHTVYIGSPSGGAAVSNDGGATWRYGATVSPIYALAVDPVVTTTIYTGSTVQWDAFVARFSTDGSALEYSTFLGGTGFDYGSAIAVDALDSAYVVGATTSTDFPVLNPLQATFGGNRDLFVAKISTAGALTYATYLGGSAWEDGGAIAIDASGQAHVAGYTLSRDFPTVQAYQPVFGGGNADAFVATLNSAGNGLVYSTYLGGSGSEMGPGAYIVGRDPIVSIAVTPSGEAYVTGATSSTDFPTLHAVQSSHGGGEFDAFVARFSATGLLQWSTFLGGAAADFGKRIALDPAGGVVVAGFSNSTDFPTRNPLQAGNAGSDDAFVARIVEDLPDVTAPTTTIAVSGTEGLAGWYRSSAVVALTATDPIGESGVAFVDYQVNGAAFQRYSSPFSVAAEGMTTVAARATDNAGNVESVPPSVVLKIDTSAPVLTVAAPVERDYLHSETLTLTFSARDEVSGLAGGSPSAMLDGAAAANGQRIQLLTLPLGVHTLVASVSDVAGNASQRVVTFHVVATIRSLKTAVNAYAAQGKIARPTQNSLLEKLDDAQDALNRGKVMVARKKLSDFIAVCRQRVVAGVANVLVADAQFVLGTL